MYLNRISRATPNRPHQFYIRRSDVAVDERVAFVESVCQVLIESRFGPDDITPWIFDWSDRPELEPADFLDLCDAEPNGLAECYDLLPLGRAGHPASEAAFQRAKQMEIFGAVPHARNSTANSGANQGRGSP